MSQARVSRLGDLVSRVETWNPLSSSAQFVYIDISSVDATCKAITAPTTLTPSSAPSRARQLVKVGDVLVSTVRPNLNAVAAVPSVLDGATASTGFTVLRPVPELLNARYLYHWVRTPEFVRHLVDRATGVSYPAVSDRVVKDTLITLPSLAEQRRIAELLDRADAMQRKREKSLRLVDELLRSVFLEMFGDPVRNEKGWDRAKLGSFGRIQGGLQVSHRRTLGREIPYLRVANVHRSRLDLELIKTIWATDTEISRTRLIRGDLLIVEGHGNPAEIGRSAVWDASIEECSHQNHIIRVRLDDRRATPDYVDAFLNSPGGRRQLLQAGKTTSGLNTISTRQVHELRIPLPPIEAQREFAAVALATCRLRTTATSDQARMVELRDNVGLRSLSRQ